MKVIFAKEDTLRNLSPTCTNSLCTSIAKKQTNQTGAQDLNGLFSKEDIEVAMKDMKRCSASVSIRELWISCTMWCRLTRVRMVSIKKSTTINAGKGMEEKEPSSLLVGMKASKSTKEKRRKVH